MNFYLKKFFFTFFISLTHFKGLDNAFRITLLIKKVIRKYYYF